MNARRIAELNGTIATILFAIAIPCLVWTCLVFIPALLLTWPCFVVMRLALVARQRADRSWNELTSASMLGPKNSQTQRQRVGSPVVSKRGIAVDALECGPPGKG
jgi:hypothetical protein